MDDTKSKVTITISGDSTIYTLSVRGEELNIYSGPEVELRARRRRDFWDRVIAKVFIDGESFATELVREGHAVFYPRWFPDRMEEKYL